MQELKRSTVLAAPKGGGHLDLVDQETGEILAQFYVPEGRSRATKWLDLAGPGQEIQIGDNLVALEPSHRIQVQDFGEQAFSSAANPSFRVTNSMRAARELDRRLKSLEAQASRSRAIEEAQARAAALPADQADQTGQADQAEQTGQADQADQSGTGGAGDQAAPAE